MMYRETRKQEERKKPEPPVNMFPIRVQQTVDAKRASRIREEPPSLKDFLSVSACWCFPSGVIS